MLHATPDTATSSPVAPRSQQARDKSRGSGFSDLLATDVPNEPTRPRETAATARQTSSPRTKDAHKSDERAAPDTDQSPAMATTDASAGQAETAQASSDKPEKPATSAEDTVSIQPADQSAPTSAAINPTAALVIPAAVPAALNNPAAVVVPAPLAPQVPTQPAMTTSSAAPLAIAAAAIATTKPATAKVSISAGETDAKDEPISAPPATATDTVQISATGSPAKTAPAADAPAIVTTVDQPVAKLDDAKPALPEQQSVSAALGKTESKPANHVAAPATATGDQRDATSASTPSPTPKLHEPRAVQAPAPDVAVATDTMPPQPQAAAQTVVNLTPVTAPLPTIIANSPAPVPMAGLAVELAARAQSGTSRFEIRLDPADLGRIDVRIDVDKQGQVTSHLTVEKPETLAMLRQDAPQLQRALNDVGLKTADGALQFTLGDQSQSHRQSHSADRQAQHFVVRDDDTVSAPIPLRSYGRLLAARGGIDISV